MLGYTIEQYLLDRANIHDTITKMALYADRRNYEGTLREVLVKEGLSIDYTALAGGEPQTPTPRDHVSAWKGMMGFIDNAHHLTTCLLAELPQPAADVPPPTTAKAQGSTMVTMHRENVKGDKLLQNGQIYDFELRKEEVSGGGNPWHISFIKITPVWFEGNMEIIIPPPPSS
ncbi:hypothetical protein CONPUDRAFT_85983 [Coniophora puteana RWD-64-598 SS2]|uniref:SnoaL-like domain-containing protein n=1 Tax=Coniophora puteana (strain RWD-64-598) TaxID=741705 RepID=R7SDP3_CONPW|nr:uncharacterized protein CONPUDRAFT_85983 [Coniophora puteana RWD-64-598 SS2]EIW74281.1 hypothetical protein CONPUDRAFT_85983 [Coniophora puteana RWD-64-598 SS2]